MKLIALIKQNDIVHGGVHLLFGQGGATLFTLFTYLLMARLMGIDEFGRFATIQATVTVLIQLFTCQTGRAYLHYSQRLQQHNDDKPYLHLLRKQCFLIDGLGCLIAIFLTVIMLSVFQDWMGLSKSDLLYAQIYSLTALSGLTGLGITMLQIAGRYKFIAIIQTAMSFLRFVMIFGVFTISAKSINFELCLLVWAVIECIQVIIFAVWGYNTLSVSYKSGLSLKSRFPGIYGFIAKTSLNAIIRIFTKDGDVLLVSYLYSPASAGIFRLLKQITSIPIKLVDPFSQAFLPLFNESIAQNNKNKAETNYKTFFRSCFKLGIFSFILLIIIGPVMLYILGPEYIENFDVYALLVIATTLWCFGAPLSALSTSLGIPGYSLSSVFIASCLYILIILVFIDQGSLVSVATGFIVYCLIYGLSLFYFVQKRFSKFIQSA